MNKKINKDIFLEMVNYLFSKTEFKFKAYDSITPDKLAENISKIGVSIQWDKLPNWESLEDNDIFQSTFLAPISSSESDRYSISTDSEFDNPIHMSYSQISEFINNYFIKNGVSFYNGDVIIVSSTNNYVYIFHHEGVYTNISGINT